MTAQCPTAGFTCVDTVIARVQAVIDQITGLITLADAGVLKADVPALIAHYKQLGELLAATVDEYTEGHGSPPVGIDVAAVTWLTHALRS